MPTSLDAARAGNLPAPTGLTAAEASRRLIASGPNEIERQRTRSPLTLFVQQFESPIIALLGVAAVVSAAIGEAADAVAIGAIVLINAIVGFLQEYRAEQALSALRSLTAPRARVRRDGHGSIIQAAEVVPGDVLVLEAGDIVAADARLIESQALTTNEAALTGESSPARKATTPTAADTPLAERADHVFMGTSVATGTGIAAVVATGMQTELGRIARLLATAEDTATPLQVRLAGVTRTLMFLCIAIVCAVAAAGLLHGVPAADMFMSAVSLAVAAVPEGLPAIVTIALAIGVQRMAARHVLIRRLPAVETLGSATVICTDKTGTLTTGVMAVRELWGADHDHLLFAAAACCDAELNDDGNHVGDPTEIAILVAAAGRGIHREIIEGTTPRVLVQPFDASIRRMSIERSDGIVYIKGAVESVWPLCADVTDEAVAANARMAGRGLRVLAVATGRPGEPASIAGLVGIADPPRTEAIEAVAMARRAGITTVMITGDHPATATAIARELGILREDNLEATVVHARATPEDKIAVVREWKRRGDIVAMTGDGVNDAPALREAHIGIAMGRTGTEVTREASDMVLADDNFASIVAAVHEGRGIFDNIRKTLVYLLAGNAAELTVMFVAAAAGLPLPLLPLHLLWINIVTDGLPALALVMDPADAGVLERPPRPPDEPMLGRPEWRTVILTGLVEASVTLATFVWALDTRGLADARSLAFSTLVVAELLRALAARSESRLFTEVGVFTNIRLLAVIVLSLGLQWALAFVPATQMLFRLGPMSAGDAVRTLLIGMVPVTFLELRKLRRRLT